MMDRENRGSSYHHCFRKENVDLPTGYFFGLSVSIRLISTVHFARLFK